MSERRVLVRPDATGAVIAVEVGDGTRRDTLREGDWRTLGESVTAAGADEAVRVLVISGRGATSARGPAATRPRSRDGWVRLSRWGRPPARRRHRRWRSTSSGSRFAASSPPDGILRERAAGRPALRRGVLGQLADPDVVAERVPQRAVGAVGHLGRLLVNSTPLAFSSS